VPAGCFTPPAIVTGSGSQTSYAFYVEEPMLRAEHNDDTAILTRWIASDYDAQQYLQGKDPCGARLNAYWQGVSYPTDEFQDLEQGNNKIYADYYFPIQGTPAVVTHLLYVKPVGITPGAGPVVGLQSRQSAYFAVMDTVTARRSAFSQASLIAANPTQSELANLVTESGGTCTAKSLSSYPGFVAPDDTGLAAGYQAMTSAQPTDGIYPAPVTATDPAAYPLAKIDYALVPTSGLSSGTASVISSFLQFAAGPGQTGTNLAIGYPVLPANLATETAAAAATVLKSAQSASPPPTTTPSTTAAPTSHPPATPPTTAPPSFAGSSFTALPSTTLSTGDLNPLQAPHVVSSAPAATTPPTTAPSPEKKVALAAEGAVAVAAASLVGGTWLLPLVLGLGLCSAVGGALLLRDSRRRARPSAAVTGSETKP
jgi:hypothetical protein